MDRRGVGERLLGAAGVVAAVFAWTMALMPLLSVGMFATADTSCDGPPQLQTDALWWAIAVLGLWLSPFIGVAVWRRSPATIALAVAAAVVASTLLTRIVLEPGQFCF
jgi:hypothetical protein